MALKRVKLILSGKVQGIYFRDFAKQNANKIGITGYAKNNKDGSLEIVAQGDERKLQDFMKICKKGPILAHVDNFVIIEEPIEEEEFDYFDIRYI